MINFRQLQALVAEGIEDLAEEKAHGWTHKHVKAWAARNGFHPSAKPQTGSHPKLVHEKTGRAVPGINPHGSDRKEAEPGAVRTTIKAIRDHQQSIGADYVPIDARDI